MKIGVPHNHGKRYKKKTNKVNKKKVFGVVCIVIILISIVLYYLQKRNNPDTQTEENIMNTVEVENNVEENKEDGESENQVNEQAEETIGSDLPDKMGNYKVIGELVIDKIGVKHNILEKTDDDSLNLSVTKFYGTDINHEGNICLTGHNYPRLLKRLKELKVGDTFYLINKEEATKVEYKIFDIYKCEPTDLECLDPRYNGVKEVTLITCNPGGLTRLICKAKEI